MDHQGPRSSRDLNNNKVKLILTGSKPEFILIYSESQSTSLTPVSDCISSLDYQSYRLNVQFFHQSDSFLGIHNNYSLLCSEQTECLSIHQNFTIVPVMQ